MTTYKAPNAVYALNSYVWKLLESNLGWTKINSIGIPFTTNAQQPELMESGSPFIVFGSALHKSQPLYALKTQSVSYTAYASTYTEANNIVNLIIQALERQDDTAADVNLHLTAENDSRGISFTSILVTMADMSSAETAEGGFAHATVMVQISYIETRTQPQYSGFTYP